MANKKLPTVQIPPVEDPKELGKIIETELNDIIIRVNMDRLGGPMDASNYRIRNLSRGVEGHDAVNVEQLEELISDTEKKFKKLSRPRRPGAVPGAFREFRGEFLQRHPEKLCKDAEPYIRLIVKLPTQANKGVGLTDELVIKRNTEYVKLQSDWTTLSSALTAGATTMSVSNPTYIKSNTLYLIESEYVRTGTVTGSNPITISRAQEGSEDVTHSISTAVKWAAIIPKEGFSADDNGILTVTPEIDNAERVNLRVFEGWSVNIDDIPGSTSTYTLTLAPGHAISDLAADPRFGEVILSWSELGGSAYRYKIFKSMDGSAISFAESQYYTSIPADGTGVKLWTDPIAKPGDANAALGTWGTTTYRYGVQAINVLCSASTGDTVGPLVGDEFPTTAATDVSGVSASESAACGSDGTTMSEVTVSWTQPSDVAKVRIYMLKDGDTNPTLVGSFDASPGKFTVPTIPDTEVQTVTLYFVSVNSGGVENTVLSSPSTTVVLDGQSSAPVPVSGLACHQRNNGAALRWTPNAECDLYGYEIADTGDVVPASQANIIARHVIDFIAATPEDSTDVSVNYDFVETLYTGNSNGTTITMDESIWPVNAHVINGVGKNIQFVGEYTIGGSPVMNPNVQCLSNAANTITFTAATIPSGIVKFHIRGSEGEHNFWVRAVNNSNQKSEWRPEPPTTLTCNPYDGNGFIDIGVPEFHHRPLFGGAYFTNNLQFLAAQCAAKGDYPNRRNINGIEEWQLRVISEDTVLGGTTTETVKLPRSNQFSTAPANAFIVAHDYFAAIPGFEGRHIIDVYGRAKNWYGWCDWSQMQDLTGASGSSTNIQRYIKQKPDTPALAADLTVSANFSLQKANVFTMTLGAASSAIAAPSNVNTGETFTIIFTQDATGGRAVTWDPKFKFPNTAWEQPNPKIGAITIFNFYVKDSSTFLLSSPPVAGLFA